MWYGLFVHAEGQLSGQRVAMAVAMMPCDDMPLPLCLFQPFIYDMQVMGGNTMCKAHLQFVCQAIPAAVQAVQGMHQAGQKERWDFKPAMACCSGAMANLKHWVVMKTPKMLVAMKKHG